MILHVLHCATCGEQMSDSAWRSFFGDRDGVVFDDGLEPTYECGCDEDTLCGRVYFAIKLTAAQLEASRDNAGAFVKALDLLWEKR